MRTEVAIVGSGIMGAIVAREVLRQRPGTDIVLVEAGPVHGTEPGRHLHSAADAATRDSYREHVAAGVQSMYVGAATAGAFAGGATATPGLYSFSALGNDARAMPAAASAWNVGGMGSHWTAACPTPWGEEIPATAAAEWEEDYARVLDVLNVTVDRFGPTPAGEAVIAALDERFGAASAPGRHPQVMPMGVFAAPDAERRRTDPSVILPGLGTPESPVRLLAETLARRVRHEDGRATGVEVEDLRSGEVRVIEAERVVVAADALRSPQLLFASGIRPAALGRYLNEHAFVTGRVFVEPDRLGGVEVPIPGDGEWMSGPLWIPHSGPAQPFHWQIGISPMYSEDLSHAVAMSVGISVYVPTEVRAESYIAFSDTETDALGLPRATIHYDYSEIDRALIDRAMIDQRAAFEAVAGPDAVGNTLLLPPGSSLHYSGTVRSGATDDGTSVVDPDGQVWGVSGVYVAGNGVLPTAVVGNVTSAGAVTAVRAARAIATGLA
ncbi:MULTISPECIES: GMC oxidoreductase [Microbacterium]|jgi:choline dehydrogenase-like flavoprotein|uniref:GMC oxidoreductase n=1 Tax=Microbacterium TaxID=33882 RepID=UPI001D172A9F|nr:GMC oxidoreductase [Microbacterium testaceum]MCC4249103.1 GMC family oxidoreductase N-terminal domain-containing protein [Microbacterium testaceum]